MNTTACDPNIDWTECDHCKTFHDTMDATTTVVKTARTLLDQAYSEYYAARDAGHVPFGTETHRAWLQHLDNLEQQLEETHAAKDTAIEQWAECIHTHHQLHENWKRNTPETGTETKEMEEVPTPMPLIRADKVMGILDREQAVCNVSIGFCDLWDLDASDLHARLATIQTIRTQLERLIDEAKEANHASH